MGTVVILIRRDQLESSIENIFSKISVKNKNLIDKSEQKLNRPDNESYSYGYRYKIYGYLKPGKFFHLSYNDIYSQSSLGRSIAYDYRLVFHLSQYQNLSEFKSILTDLVGEGNARSIFIHGKIIRLDIWLDLPYKFTQMKFGFLRSHVRVQDKYQNKLRTIYFGQRKPKCTVIYEKPNLNENQLDLPCKPNKDKKKVVYCRVELRFFNSKVPIQFLNDYPKMTKMDLFKGQKLFLISKKMFVQHREDWGKAKVKLFLAYVKDCKAEGAYLARKKYNENRDFYRVIQPLIEKISKNIELSKLWDSKLKDKLLLGFTPYEGIQISNIQFIGANNETEA